MDAVERDLFIVFAAADRPFVEGYLVPALGLPAERILLSNDLALGQPILVELERGVRTSRLAVLVLTPAAVDDRESVVAELLASHASGAGGQVIPLLLVDCTLPLRLGMRVALDFRNEADWPTEADKLRASLGRAEPAEQRVPCPYPGMRPYEARDAERFHGRDREIDEVLDRLRAGDREIYVVGSSGSGKSSLVAAGVLPRLERGASGLPAYIVRHLRPGDGPTRRLRDALGVEPAGSDASCAAAIDAIVAGHPAGTSLLVVVDQIEELFTLAPAGERTAFAAALQPLRSTQRCVLIFTLRADFFGAFIDSEMWTGQSGRPSRVEIAPLRGAALRDALERPARAVGVCFGSGLVERLIADSAGEPGILPLLQETLIQLWDRLRRRLLTLAAYDAMGDSERSGLAVAISRRADAALRSLTPAQELLARRTLIRLVSFGEGRPSTRRQQPRSRLAAGCDAHDFEIVLARLVEDRVLTIQEVDGDIDSRIDLSHEAEAVERLDALGDMGTSIAVSTCLTRSSSWRGRR